MLPELLKAMVNDSVRGDDRMTDRDPAASTLAQKPSILGRRTVRTLAFLGIAGIFYGTLIPFQIEAGREWSWHLHWGDFVPSDAVANVSFYIPIGIFLRLIIRRRGSFWLTEWAFCLAAAAGMSYLSEVCQTILVYRVPSLLDTLFNVCGTVIGVAIAPGFQRLLRNQHAWIYHELRVRPFTAAASATLIVVITGGLMPFDVHPTLNHVTGALHRLETAPLMLPWTSAYNPTIPLTPVELFDKLASASTYALMAFMLLLSVRETGETRQRAMTYALTRSIALASTIEILQLFTVAHVTDPRDLLAAWMFCAIGTAAGYKLCVLSRSDLPKPTVVLRGLVMVIGIGVISRAIVVATLPNPYSSPGQTINWLPMAGSFYQSWSKLLGNYTADMLRYAVFAALLILWARSNRRLLHWCWVVGTTLAAALIGQLLALNSGQPIDSAQLLIAAIAGAIVVRLDRAIFGYKSVVARNPIS